MMAGVPVITVHAASLPEVGGKYALYVDTPEPALLAGQIRHVLGLEKEQRDELVGKGREWAQRFSWQRTATQTLSVLQSIAAETK